jgi:DNA-directed RNA polymerase specialized sigma24 family protein
VEGMKYREISDTLGVEISENSATVGDYSTVAKMVRRGREILKEAYGHDGWDELAASMKREFFQRDPASEEG